MRQHRSTAVALELATQPRPKDDRAGQRDETADRVNHRGSRKIVKTCSNPGKEIAGATHGCKESVRSPGPVPNDRVNEPRDGKAIYQVSPEARAPDHRSGCNSGTGVSKS